MPSEGPVPGKRNVLITSALPYVNNVPHLGNLVGSVLSGDVFARYCKLRDYETLYVSGTDEYGTASETKALEENKTPKEICDEYHAIHKQIYDWFNIQFDEFGRTTNEHQTALAQEIFTKLEQNNYLFQETVAQLYCGKCSRFLADRFVEGTCPSCKYEDARGDQCDKCGKLINAIELRDPLCKLCKTSPVIRDSKHFFFDLPKVEQKLKTWYQETISRSAPPPKPFQSSSLASGDSQSAAASSREETATSNNFNAAEESPASQENSVDDNRPQKQQSSHTLSPNDTHWTNTTRSITESWFKDGLKPRCITRDLKWGTKVPYEGFEDKVFYVWFDAPIGYLSITAKHTRDWQKWWKGEEAQNQVELYQFLAKDNVLFHSIMFPATLFATHEPWIKVKTISATDYLNYENTKFSKSRGLGVFGSDAKDTGIPADIWRFYLMYIRPEGQDSSFCWDDFKEKVNGELLNNLGNFINRIVSFVDKNFSGQMSCYEPNDEDLKVLEEVGQNLIAYEERLERVMLRDGLKPILAIGRLGNQLIQANKPWALMKGDEADKRRAETVLHIALNIIALISLIISPYMPEVSKQIKQQLAFDCDHLVEMTSPMPMLLSVGHKIGAPALLFKRLEQDQIKELKQRFGTAATQQQPLPASNPSKSKSVKQSTKAAKQQQQATTTTTTTAKE